VWNISKAYGDCAKNITGKSVSSSSLSIGSEVLKLFR
jgi:hypothetical protein